MLTRGVQTIFFVKIELKKQPAQMKFMPALPLTKPHFLTVISDLVVIFIKSKKIFKIFLINFIKLQK